MAIQSGYTPAAAANWDKIFKPKKSSFAAHLDRASEEVASWPAWKRRIAEQMRPEEQR